jgi:RNA polymerase sigma factor (sigma-70 family)
LNQGQTELIFLLQQGDESAFRQLVDAYEGMVYNTVLGIVQNEADADDVTQDVFIQVYQSVHSFKGDAKFSTWLYRIAVSKSLDHLKRKKRKKRFAFVQGLFGSAGEVITDPPDFNHPGIVLENKERAGELFRALEQIPENQRIAFTLHKLEGTSYQEVAVIMDTSLYAVESLMGRAKSNLKKLLKDYYEKKLNKK